jgi:hypothetical protein
LALDPNGRIVARHSVPTPISYPRSGWVEQSGDEVWRATTTAIAGCLTGLPVQAKIAAIGISNQRETVLLWRRSTGETIGPCVTWQCRRSSGRIDALRTSTTEELVEATTGLGLDPLCLDLEMKWGHVVFSRLRRSVGCSTPIPRRAHWRRVVGEKWGLFEAAISPLALRVRHQAHALERIASSTSSRERSSAALEVDPQWRRDDEL